LHSALKSCSLG